MIWGSAAGSISKALVGVLHTMAVNTRVDVHDDVLARQRVWM
jgi:hypothetical protein